ncbi:MAG TPA: hypothetical protein VGN74_03430 [Brevundimonas sp.]|uniref:hypothetical protein n=1 Tax=Brevundimonas sp. TaxID=1871086 RepID=UPI002E14B3EB|nr:hypothetical protein [Brevundimonas sp.]
MTTRWLIDVRLGVDPRSAPLRRRIVQAATEAEALRRLAEDVACGSPHLANDQLLIDGQEEVFARAEIEQRLEHHAGEDAPRADSAAAQTEGRRDR